MRNLPDGTRRYNTLYRYVIDENHMDGDKTVISGHHEAVCNPSRSLQKRLVENGMPSEKLAQFVEAEAVAV